MTWLSDAAVNRLRDIADRPDVSGTRYEIVDMIARGGMGVVYVGLDRELGREVAIKVLGTASVSADAAARLDREARILARLEHPGIVPVHDLGRLPDGRLFYVMKLVRGPRLDEHVARTPALGERLRIFQRICEAVSFAHARGVIHRDLKPANVMVGPFGEVLVLDWGVARLADGARDEARSAGPDSRQSGDSPSPGGHTQQGTILGTPGYMSPEQARGDTTAIDERTDGRHTQQGTILGTPGYMSPEQARGDTTAIDERTDVYALGAILQFLLTESAGTQAVKAEAEGGDQPRGPAAIAAVSRKAMAEDPAARYQTVSALSDDIARFLAGLSVGAYRETLLEKGGRIVRAFRIPILLVLAYLLMRALLLVFRAP